MNIAIIGAGITGVSAARMAKELGIYAVVFEKASMPGGLVKCERLQGHLFHRVGGHVFNSRNQAVTDWFWKFFDKENDFIQAQRKAGILFQDQVIGYPIENYLYKLNKSLVRQIVTEILTLSAGGYKPPFSHPDFESFLKGNFGETLYNVYFGPYNEKIWHTDLKNVPLEWLEGKLPMPDYAGILLSNIVREEETSMVHSSFYYPRYGGSQFIIDTLMNGLDIRCNQEVRKIGLQNGRWRINDEGSYDCVIYTGDVRVLGELIDASEVSRNDLSLLRGLRSNGTSNVLCETDETELSWLYLPDMRVQAHRIIYTGNFSATNNADGRRKSCVVEFSGKLDPHVMVRDLALLPGNLTPIEYNYEPNSYVIQDQSTRKNIRNVKSQLEPIGFYLCGRFAEWEYYNMDKAIEAAMALPMFNDPQTAKSE